MINICYKFFNDLRFLYVIITNCDEYDEFQNNFYAEIKKCENKTWKMFVHVWQCEGEINDIYCKSV